jgi:alpha-L-fucosidase
MAGDWYARNMYIEGSEQYLYHLRHYGHPSQFGYKDIVKLWKAERFQPDELMDKYVKAGAKYFVGQAMHHDHFFNFPSKLNRFNSTQIGPMKDICGMWKAAAENRHLPFGLTEHMSASFSWWRWNKGSDKHGPFAGVPYDGNDPAYRDYYFDNREHYSTEEKLGEVYPWYTANKQFHDYWLAVMKELIDIYTPDLLYSDGGVPFGMTPEHEPGYTAKRDSEYFQRGLDAIAYLYNKSIDRYGENRAVYNQKDPRPEIYRVGVLDIERSQLPGIQPYPWQTDTCIGDWFYNARQTYKRPGHIINMLVDIISKNGSLLLNILQRPDGTIDEEAEYILRELAAWNAVCAEGVYGTRPWRVFGEGETSVTISGFTEEATPWTSADFRFVCKGKTLYAFIMQVPENGVAVIKSLNPNEVVKSVRLLGEGPVPFVQSFGVLTVQLPGPDRMPTVYTNCLAIELG